MAFRFLRRIQIVPGVRLNVSKRGASISLGPRGASVTVGRRGIWGNAGLPGTGLSYRRRLGSLSDLMGTGDKTTADPAYELLAKRYSSLPAPGPTEHEQNEAYVQSLQALLLSREQGDIDWSQRADPGAAPPDDDEDADAFDVYARRVAMARFARRMVEGDRAAWCEVLAEELRNEELPFEFTFDFGVDDENDAISISIELPDIEVVPHRASRPLKNGGVRYRKLPVSVVRELYEDVCCALLLRFIHEVYRTIPEADHVSAQGFRRTADPATGAPVRSVYLACVTDRASFRELNLDAVDPSTAFAHLGGAARLSRGMITPIGTSAEPQPEA